MTPVQKILATLKTIAQSDEITSVEGQCDHYLVEQAVGEATDALVGDWEAIQQLKAAGYDVFPLERDGFGWLLGGIRTSKGVIVFG